MLKRLRALPGVSFFFSSIIIIIFIINVILPL